MEGNMIEKDVKKERHVEFNEDELSQDASVSSAMLTPGVYYPKKPKTHHTNHSPSPFKKSTRRIVFKNGLFNIESQNKQRFLMKNVFVTLVEGRWRWTLFGFFLAFTFNWLVYGLLYWFIAWKHGDLEEEHLPPNQTVSDWTPCVENIYGFTSTFLFSVEVHTTVAYGARSITLECPEAIITMCFQCILSSIFQAFMVGILFAKLTRPKARTQTILFSKCAVVNMRDDNLCLIFRVGDIRYSRILDIKSMAFVIYMNSGDEIVENQQIELKTQFDGNESAFFVWPLQVVHVIDQHSPLYYVSAADLICGKIEILVVFEGVIETTGQPIQARTSYTEKDILWGHRFESMVTIDHRRELFNVDFSKLSSTERIDTPLCSVAEYREFMTEDWALAEDSESS
ncbi:inward rectifier potassium channel domain-containing protein [Phthorimaea operculella]|nr:inward rectifier potassium channel domain-containing protein [Phthorimaea operculella]